MAKAKGCVATNLAYSRAALNEITALVLAAASKIDINQGLHCFSIYRHLICMEITIEREAWNYQILPRWPLKDGFTKLECWERVFRKKEGERKSPRNNAKLWNSLLSLKLTSIKPLWTTLSMYSALFESSVIPLKLAFSENPLSNPNFWRVSFNEKLFSILKRGSSTWNTLYLNTKPTRM